MKPENNEIKGRKVASFIENIFRNIPSVLLGAVLFGLIFLGYFLLNDKVAKDDVNYAGIIGVSINYNSDDAKEVSTDDFMDALKSDKVKDAIDQEVSMDKSFSTFISDAQVDYSDGTFSIAYFNDDEAYAKTIVSKLYNAVCVVLMDEYDIANIQIDKPVYYKVYDKTGGYVDSLGLKGYTLLGAAVGAVLSLIVICTFYLLDNTIKNAVDVKRYFNLPVLSVIPEVKDKEEE